MSPDRFVPRRCPARLLCAAASALSLAAASASRAATSPAVPHIEIVSAQVSPSTPVAGQTATFFVTVTNTGAAAMPSGTSLLVNFSVDWAVNMQNPPSIPALAPGASAVVQMNWKAVAGAHELVLAARPQNTIAGIDLVNSSRHLPFFVQSTGPAPVLYLPSGAVAPNGGSASLGVAVPANPGDALSVTLTSDRLCPSGSSLALVSSTLIYTPCAVSAAIARPDLISYTVTDTTNGTTIAGKYAVTLALDNTTAATNPTVTYNATAPLPNWGPALAAVMAGTPGARARIIALGDSTTQGHGEELFGSTFEQGQDRSYPEQLSTDLAALGVPSVHDSSAYGANNILNARISFVGGTALNGQAGAGGENALTQSPGDGYDYNTSRLPAFDHVDILFIDGSGQFTVSVDGGPVQCTHAEGQSAMTLNYSCAVTPGRHSVVSVRQIGQTGTFFQGLATWSSTAPAVELFNVGIGGAFSSQLDVPYPAPLYNYGQLEAAYALQPQLAIINFGTNDFNDNTTLNQTGNNTVVQQVAINYQQAITSLKQAGTDPVIVIFQPFANPNYQQILAQWRAAAVQLAYANNVPLIDMSATFEDDFYALPHLDNLHPNEQGYIDMGRAYARVLTGQ